jgi:hypothetical protein
MFSTGPLKIIKTHLMPQASGLGSMPTIHEMGLSVVSGKSGFLKMACTAEVVSPHFKTLSTVCKKWASDNAIRTLF